MLEWLRSVSAGYSTRPRARPALRQKGSSMKKTVFALWIATLMVLGYGLRNYNRVAREYATQMDAQSIEIYRYADNMQATYFVLLIAVFVVGMIVIGINTWHQSYRDQRLTRPKPLVKSSYEEDYKSRLVYLAPTSLLIFLMGVVSGLLGESYFIVAPLLILGVILGAIAKVNYVRYAELMDVKTHGNHSRQSYL